MKGAPPSQGMASQGQGNQGALGRPAPCLRGWPPPPRGAATLRRRRQGRPVTAHHHFGVLAHAAKAEEGFQLGHKAAVAAHWPGGACMLMPPRKVGNHQGVGGIAGDVRGGRLGGPPQGQQGVQPGQQSPCQYQEQARLQHGQRRHCRRCASSAGSGARATRRLRQHFNWGVLRSKLVNGGLFG